MRDVWRSRPASLGGRGRDDWAYSTLCGAVALLGGVSALSRWTPSSVVPTPRMVRAVVTERVAVADDVVALTLADPNGGLLPTWTPGAHLEVHLASGLRRQYSLCGLPGDRRSYRIAVRRLDDGRGGSREIHATLGEGDHLDFSGPRNAFPLVGDGEVLFVAGGIGVTPILPMIQAARASGRQWQAVYAGRSRASMPLLEEVVGTDPERVTVWADDERGAPPAAEDLLASAGPRTAVYVCGPASLLDSVRLARAGVDGAALHYERFGAPKVVGGVGFDIELARTGTVLRVPADRSALDVMLDHNPRTPSSCRQGFCGTCKVRVLAGDVDRRGTAIERSDEMLVCVSRGAGTRVVIDA